MSSIDSSDSPESVAEFIDYLTRWERYDQRPIAFRGQSFHRWLAIPKVFRPDVGLYDFEKNAIRDLVSIHPQEFQNDETMFDRLVRMQHFGLPTRLLDVTTNPLVALYFATEPYTKKEKEEDGKVQAFFLPEKRQKYYDSDRVSCMANLSNFTADEKKEIAKIYHVERGEFNKSDIVRRLLWFVRIEKPHFEPNINPIDLRLPVFVKPKMSNRRIIAQSGAFVIYGARRLITKEIDDDLRLRRVLIRAEFKKKIRKELETIGIHASALFPEIDKAAEFIVARYRSASS